MFVDGCKSGGVGKEGCPMWSRSQKSIPSSPKSDGWKYKNPIDYKGSGNTSKEEKVNNLLILFTWFA